ncbi:MAG: hypothetical protein ACRC2T_09670 [Thermoguttaceae bacterium]
MKKAYINCFVVVALLLTTQLRAEYTSLATGLATGGKNSAHDPDANYRNSKTGDNLTRGQDANRNVTITWDPNYAVSETGTSNTKKAYTNYSDTSRSNEWKQNRKAVETSLKVQGTKALDGNQGSFSATVDGKPFFMVKEGRYDGAHYYVGSTTSVGGNAQTNYTAAADVLKSNDRSMSNGYQQLVRDGSDAQVLTSTISENQFSRYFSYDDDAKTFVKASNIFDAVSGTAEVSKNTGIQTVMAGLYAFTNSFKYDASTSEFGFMNGYISVIGVLEGIYINGNLLDESMYWMGKNTIDSNYAYMGSWDFELDFAALMEQGYLNEDGNNNISFMVDYVPEAVAGIGDSWNHGIGAFVADIGLNTESIQVTESGTDPAATPEPATALILGATLIGLPFARRFGKKQSV